MPLLESRRNIMPDDKSHLKMTQQFRKYLIVLGPFLMIFMFALFVNFSIADMYKWVDENGVAHFSDTPPADTDNPDIETLPTYTTLENKGIHGYNEIAYINALK